MPDILANGADAHQALGCSRSRGTLPFQLSDNIKYGGLVEVPFGLTLRELLLDFGGGSRSNMPLKGVQVGGPLGAYLPESQFDTPIDYEAFTALVAMTPNPVRSALTHFASDFAGGFPKDLQR